MSRPLVPIALFYAAGILCSLTPIEPLPLFGLALALTGLFLLFPNARRISLFALILIAGWINTAERNRPISPLDLRNQFSADQQLVTLRGKLLETPAKRLHLRDFQEVWSSHAEMAVTGLKTGDEWQPASGRVMTLTRAVLPETFFAGATVEIHGLLEKPQTALAEGLFDYADFLNAKEIYFDLKTKTPDSWKILDRPSEPPWTDRFSKWGRSVIGMGLPTNDPTVRLEGALTFGWKEFFTPEVADPFIKASTLHVFAVDGLRVVIISTTIVVALRMFLRVPRRYAALISLPFLIFYTAMTGWPASAIRALVMVCVIYGGWWLKRPGEAINTLMTAALLILIWQPQQLFQAGFQLSFVVVFCIILIMPVFEELGQRLRFSDPLLPDELISRWKRCWIAMAKYSVEWFLIALAAWLGSIPLVAYYFHIITPWSGLINVLAVPLCALVLIANLASLCFAGWFPWLTVLMNHAAWAAMNGLNYLSLEGAKLPTGYFYVPMPSLFTITLYYGILIALFTGWFWRKEFRQLKFIALILALVAWVGGELYQRRFITATILPLPGGHATYVKRAWSSDDCLVNCGNDLAFENVSQPYLEAQGVNRLNTFILTHGESHFSGAALETYGQFSPRNLFINANPFRSPEYRQFLDAMRGNSALRPPLASGTNADDWQILYPPANSNLPKAADKPLVLRRDFFGHRLLLLANPSHAGQRELLKTTRDLQAEIAVIQYSSIEEPITTELLSAVKPLALIVVDSTLPAGEHEKTALRSRYANLPIELFFTSENGAISCRFAKTGFELTAHNQNLFVSKP